MWVKMWLWNWSSFLPCRNGQSELVAVSLWRFKRLPSGRAIGSSWTRPGWAAEPQPATLEVRVRLEADHKWRREAEFSFQGELDRRRGDTGTCFHKVHAWWGVMRKCPIGSDPKPPLDRFWRTFDPVDPEKLRIKHLNMEQRRLKHQVGKDSYKHRSSVKTAFSSLLRGS